MLRVAVWMGNRARDVWTLLRDAGFGWSRHQASRIGAALAFYTVFSLGPILLLAVAIAGFFFGEGAARSRIYAEAARMIGPKAATQIRAVLLHSAPPGTGMIATAVSVVVLIISANVVLVELKSGLDVIWEVPQHHRQWFRTFVRDRLLSIGLVFVLGLLLLLSLLAGAAISALSTLSQSVAVIGVVLDWASEFVSFALATLFFATIYKVLPRYRIGWKDVWIGAVMTAALVTAGRLAIRAYIGMSRVAPAYGAAGSLIVLLLWVYYSAQVFLFGAELTREYARRFGSHRRAS